MAAPAEPSPDGPTARVFFAFWPGPEIAGRLHAIAGRCAETCGGRVMRRETLHLTLVFVGAVPESRLPELAAIAGGLAAPAVDLVIDRFDYWPHNRIVWAGGTPAPSLTALSAGLSARLREAGFPVERGAFVPHVTLLRNARCTADRLAATTAGLALTWPLRELLLVRSCLGPEGATYEPVGRWPLTAVE